MSSFDWKKNVEDSIVRWTHCHCHYHRNIFRIQNGKCKATKGISGCHGYHKTCWWNLWMGAGEGLCSPQKLDQRVNKTILYPYKGNKILYHQMQMGCATAARPSNSFLCYFTFQWLKYHWNL